MAGRGRSQGIPHHPLPAALAADPNKPPHRATRLFGYPGPAAAAKSTRLWVDADLSSYVDIPDAAILHSQTLDDDRGTILWVDPEARLTYSTTGSHEVQAKFLNGAIVEGNLARGIPNLVPAMLKPESRAPDICWEPVTLSESECPVSRHCWTEEFPCEPV